jgi:predicted secreted hydrolase
MMRVRLLLFAVLAMCPAGAAVAQQSGTWRNAEPGRALRLPADHASHPEYRIEWWYYTGNLTTTDGRRFGYQLTFFRIGVDPSPANPSRWAVRDLFMGHLAVTDVGRGRHRAVERLSRPGVGWAGARADGYRVWIDDWHVELQNGRHRLTAASASPAFAIDLSLGEGRPPVFHGNRGFSQKGSEPGNASHYYSLTRMPTSGTIRLVHERVAVAGASWMDHEFGSSFLEKTQGGWDWFSIQLDDGEDLMLYRLRGGDGSTDPRSSGTAVARNGFTTSLTAGAFTVTPGRRWASPTSGANYPVEWRIDVPGQQLALSLKPALDEQEMHAGLQSGIAYWEGAVDVAGTRNGRPVTGRGYLEMSGYSGRPLGELLGRVRP